MEKEGPPIFINIQLKERSLSANILAPVEGVNGKCCLIKNNLNINNKKSLKILGELEKLICLK